MRLFFVPTESASRERLCVYDPLGTLRTAGDARTSAGHCHREGRRPPAAGNSRRPFQLRGAFAEENPGRVPRRASSTSVSLSWPASPSSWARPLSPRQGSGPLRQPSAPRRRGRRSRRSRVSLPPFVRTRPLNAALRAPSGSSGGRPRSRWTSWLGRAPGPLTSCASTVTSGSARGAYYDDEDLAFAAAASVAAAPTALRDIGHVVLFLPRRLSSGEGALVDALATAGHLSAVVGLTGEDDTDTLAPRNRGSPGRVARSGHGGEKGQ